MSEVAEDIRELKISIYELIGQIRELTRVVDELARTVVRSENRRIRSGATDAPEGQHT
jgi:hypothetical protein